MKYVDTNIFSIDESRFFVENKGSGLNFCKLSSLREYESLLYAKQILESYSTLNICGHNHKIVVPDVYDFKNNIINMKYFRGQNLESLLRNKNTHKIGVKYLNEIFTFLFDKGFGWQDFAPRNILLNSDIICLVDFEKGISNCINDKTKYLQNHVYEEYSSFLFEKERCISIDEVFAENDNAEKIDLNSIKIKRCKYLCDLLYNKSEISCLEYYKAWKKILKAEIPFVIDNNIIFPRIFLSKTLANKDSSNAPYYNYANKILEINNCTKNNDKVLILKSIDC